MRPPEIIENKSRHGKNPRVLYRHHEYQRSCRSSQAKQSPFNRHREDHRSDPIGRQIAMATGMVQNSPSWRVEPSKLPDRPCLWWGQSMVAIGATL
jgi:hypothetical protein